MSHVTRSAGYPRPPSAHASCLHLDDRDLTKRLQRLVVRVLGDYREGVCSRSCSDPEVVDVHPAPSLSQLNPQPGPFQGDGLIHREKLHVGDGIEGRRSSRTGTRVPSGENPNLQLRKRDHRYRGLLGHQCLINATADCPFDAPGILEVPQPHCVR